MYPLNYGTVAFLNEVTFVPKSILVDLWEVVFDGDVIGEELVVETREGN